MGEELVSAIIPTYNRASLLVRALASVAGQDYRPIQAIVIDDGSTDNTAELMPEQQSLLARQGVEMIYHRQSNCGPAYARNVGISLARGPYVCFLDSDDMWTSSFVSTMVRLLKGNPSAGLAFGGYMAIDANDQFIKERKSGLPPKPPEGLLRRPFELIVQHMPMGTPCVMVRRSVLDELGGFDETYHMGEDWDLWYRIAGRHDFVYSLKGLSCCREHRRNTPKFNAAALADQVLLIHKHLPSINDPKARAVVLKRLARQTTLLQEQMLREGYFPPKALSLLDHPLGPQTLRFRLGATVRRQPAWVGKAYARIIRALGTARR